MNTRNLAACVLVLIASACAATAPKIDGSSEAAFNESHQKLIDSLSPADRMRLTLAEVVYLSKFECSREKEPIPGQPALTSVSGGGIMLVVACRKELDGKGFSEIIRLGKLAPGGK